MSQPKKPKHQKQPDNMTQLLFEESDRGCVVILADMLDEALEEAIKAGFDQSAYAIKHAIEPLFSGLGPLTTLSAKLKLAYASKIISEVTFDNLEILRRLRNEVAHSSGEVDLCEPPFSDIIKPLIDLEVFKELFDTKRVYVPSVEGVAH